MKPNNTLMYINKQSNHPPASLKNIPKNVNVRITRNSATEEIFNEAKGPYQNTLNASGYNFELKYDSEVKLQQQQQRQKRQRHRKITWFNPPFSLNVKTNVASTFLQIVKECFPSNHPLHKICNRNAIKGSYRTMPNMRKNISRHNNKLLQSEIKQQNPALFPP